MSTIATMVINLITRTAGFEDGLDRAKRKTKTFEDQLDAANRKMLKTAFGFKTVRKAIRVLADEISRANEEGRKLSRNDLTITLVRSIPFFGEAANAIAQLAIYLSTSNDELERMARAAANAAAIQLRYNKLLAEKKLVEDHIANLILMADHYGKTAREITESTLRMAGATEEQLKYADSIHAVIDRMRAYEEAAARAAQVKDFIRNLQEQVDLFGRSAAAIDEYRLRLMGATEEQIKMARALREQLDELERMADLQRRAEQIIREIRSPLEVFNDSVRELQELLDEGLLTLEQYEKAVAKAREEFERLADVAAKPEAPRLIERRFTAGFGQSGDQLKDPVKESAKRLRELTDQGKKDYEMLRGIRDNTGSASHVFKVVQF